MMLQNLDPVLLLLSGVLLAAVGALVWMAAARSRSARDEQAATVRQLMEHQAQLAGRLGQFAEQSAGAQAALQGSVGDRLQAQERAITRMLDERLGALTRRVGDSLHQQTTQTQTTIGDLKERLGAINAAQERITKLSEQVVSLQDVLSNKQARGGFGEIQLEDQVKAALPPSAYEFQFTLSNKTRVDCMLKLPNPPGPIGVDSKFPFESFNAIRNTPDGEERLRARKAFGRDVLVHVKAIADKYILPGETADCALMFLPSEAIYAELHAELPDIVEQAHRARVYICSPTTLMALLNTIRAVLKDTQMREQAGLIQKEVHTLNQDVARLGKRVENLRSHFGQANKDIEEIETSARKITSRAAKIDAVELADIDPLEAVTAPGPADPPPRPTLVANGD